MKPKDLWPAGHLEELQKNIRYRFSNVDLLKAALIHPSLCRRGPHPFPRKIRFQRLEFLGDRLLASVLGTALFELFPSEREGFLSRAYMALARRDSLAHLAQQFHLEDFLKVGKIRLTESTLEDSVEALMGAIFLDSDYATIQQCILSWFGDIPDWIDRQLLQLNHKGQLQEFLGERMHELHYELVQACGPIHERTFCMAVFWGNRYLAQAEGHSKQEAEERAAAIALDLLKNTSASSPTTS